MKTVFDIAKKTAALFLCAVLLIPAALSGATVVSAADQAKMEQKT